MFVFELLLLVVVVLSLLYAVFFSPRFDRFSKKIFGRSPDTADGIVDAAAQVKADSASVDAAKASRAAELAREQSKLDSIK